MYTEGVCTGGCVCVFGGREEGGSAWGGKWTVCVYVRAPVHNQEGHMALQQECETCREQ